MADNIFKRIGSVVATRIDTVKAELQAEIQNISTNIGSGEKHCNFTGNVKATQGIARWYPENNITVTGVVLTLGESGGTNTIIDIKKNGESLFPGAKPTLVAGSNRSSVIPVATTASDNDYFTVDVLDGSGKYLLVSIQYEVQL